MKKRFYLSLVILLVAGMLLSACGGVQQNSGASGNVLNVRVDGEPPNLDSAVSTDNISFNLLNAVMEGLTRLDKDNKPQLAMAESYTISPDKKTYTFKLRDAKWSDGRPVRAQDFEYGWKRALAPQTASQYAYILYPILNAEKYNTGKAKAEDVGVKALDDKTLQVKLEAPSPYFLGLTSFATYLPQRQDIVEKYGKQYAQEPNKMVYNGPFVLASWQHNESYTLKKNPNYWDKATVKLDGINFKIVKEVSSAINLYKTNGLDYVPRISQEFVDAYKSKPDFKPVTEATTVYLEFNMKKEKVLRNVKIRKAIQMGIDTNILAQNIAKEGKPATALVPPTLQGGNGKLFRDQAPGYVKFNKEEAKKLLAEGLKEEGLSQFPTMELLGDDTDVAKRCLQFIKEQLRTNLGINVNIRSVPFKERLQRSQDGNFQIVLSRWGADYDDAMTFLDLFLTGNAFNRGGYSNPKYDDLIKKAKMNPDFNQRLQQMVEAEKILIQDDAGIAPLYWRQRQNLERPNIKGLVHHPFGPDDDFKWATLNK
ncbi:peptide ABC transporter substrate-binding protein [Polycladomyces subterraneus]|uniref:Peptide ABC transporter substrate-binding protein n=1 Tax=Polycladomyces subterraneus TaxID=1016997 RepID=A0ABT8IRR1_9BACL|nr:peptide ABC transporter substrate-binding protein [Polycladomyces subterraneus]MDN4595474.1 peptide ABC transporter substrate-binding protein [Polycladomyces subterraneus]